jgi:hypothetical protein
MDRYLQRDLQCPKQSKKDVFLSQTATHIEIEPLTDFTQAF